MHRVDVESGKIIDCDCDNEISFRGEFSLTVEELISLHGGIMAQESFVPNVSHKCDVDTLWNIAKQSNEYWNSALAVLCEFEKRTVPKRDRININLDLQTLAADIRDYNRKFNRYYDFMKTLLQHDIITDLSVSGTSFSYKYKNATVRRCLNTPGDILEMKTYYEALCFVKNDKPFFDSCNIGVKIDWDGVVHSLSSPIKDTKNELNCRI